MSVQLDYTAVFQITGHLNSTFPAPAGGMLLGTGPDEREDSDEIRITESFALPHAMVEGSGAQLRSRDAQDYVASVVSKLSKVGADPHVEGWYLSSSVGAIYDQQVFDNLWFLHQKNPDSFLLVNDVALSRATGTTSLRAFRLSPQFVALRKANPSKLSTEQLIKHKVDYRNLLEELPIVIKNSVIVHRFTQHYNATHPQSHTAAEEALRVVDQRVMEARGDAAMDTIDDLNFEQNNYNYYQRQLARERQKVATWTQKRKAENVHRVEQGEAELPMEEWKSLFSMPDEPSRLENLLLSAQLDEHATLLQDVAAGSSATILPTKFA